MRRREFITLAGSAAAAWPLPAGAQQSNHTARVAVLLLNAESDPAAQSWHQAFLQGLRALGWVDGGNVQIDVGWAGGEPYRLAYVAKELLDTRPDVVLAVTTPAVKAVRQISRSVPIVFTQVTDPVAQGLVTSLSRPGGNLTGFAILEPAIGGKWVQLLKEIAPEVTRVAVIFNPDTAPYYKLYMSPIEAAAQSAAIAVVEAPVRGPSEIETVMSGMANGPVSGIIEMSDGYFGGAIRDLVIALAARYKLPAAYGFRQNVAGGGLFSYGVDLTDMHRRAALYVDRILKGAMPSELPIQLPAKFEFVINLKTAKSLGLKISPALLSVADELLE
jgi:putative ABC transport system substrate-binding protein